MSSYIPNILDDPQFIPGENIGTGNGEPVLTPPTCPGEALTEFGELDVLLWAFVGLFLVEIVWTVVLLIVALQAVMSTLRIQRMAGDIGRNDTELLAAYLAMNKRTEDPAAQGVRTVAARTEHDGLLAEMQWLSVDFSQETALKKAVARMLAHEAKEFVETWPERKVRKEHAQLPEDLETVFTE